MHRIDGNINTSSEYLERRYCLTPVSGINADENSLLMCSML
jgi:hypothetical protein